MSILDICGSRCATGKVEKTVLRCCRLILRSHLSVISKKLSRSTKKMWKRVLAACSYPTQSTANILLRQKNGRGNTCSLLLVYQLIRVLRQRGNNDTTSKKAFCRTQ